MPLEKVFVPTPSWITYAVREYLGRLTVPTRPTSGLNWRVYVESGGPARYIGKRNAR